MDTILLTQTGAIATITLNRPEKLNAFGSTMREDLRATLQQVAEDASIRVVILTGAGRAFCAGGDVPGMGKLREQGDDARFLELLHLGRGVVTLLRTMPQPSIAAVNGVAAGAGFSLALACDLRIAAADAKFIASFGKLGLHPDWGMSYTLPRLIGPARALELALTAEPVGAEEALRIGLVNRIAPAEELLEAAGSLARTLAVRSPHAMSRVRETFGSSLERTFDEAFEAEISAQLSCFASEDVGEGIRAFQERREPIFQGR